MPAKPVRKPPAATSRNPATERARPKPKVGQSRRGEDIPEPTPEDFARAIARKGLRPVPPKRQLTLRIDADVLDWFKAKGKGYQSQINALLRAYMDARRERG